MRWLLPLALLACDPSAVDGTEDTLGAGHTCGDGIVDAWEACDDGDANSDSAPDACRTTCVLPTCGDAATDVGEGCDDGNVFGGDGCDPKCLVETAPGETEPNDLPAHATLTQGGATVAGGLPEFDVDCWAVDVAENAWISARVTTDDGGCDAQMVLRLRDPEGREVADDYAEGLGDCAHIDPAAVEEATYLAAGRWTVCVEGLFLAAVPAYRLSIEVGDDSCLTEAFDPKPEDDPDGDGLADICDGDDDGDGRPDETDNCPRTPNHGASTGFDTSRDGWIRQWLLSGAVTGRELGSEGSCHPSEGGLEGGDDGLLEPSLADAWGESGRWIAHTLPEGGWKIDFTDRFSASAPREVWAVAWVHAESEQEAVLAVGADDGSRVWFDGEMVGDDPTCHGVTADHFRYPVTLTEGWHRVMVQVRDHGGGWGLAVRFKDADTGAPITTLATSFTDAPWYDVQSDRDGDGIGDVCDDTP